MKLKKQLEQLLVPHLRKTQGQTIARRGQAELAQAQRQFEFAALAVAVQCGGALVIVHAETQSSNRGMAGPARGTQRGGRIWRRMRWAVAAR